MAERRMFAKTIVDSDDFFDLSMAAQLLYYHLGMNADDDGFVNGAKKIIRMMSKSDEEHRLFTDGLEELITQNYLISFESGIVLIAHWKTNNYIQKDRYKETSCKEEKQKITCENGVYKVLYPKCIQSVSKMYTQDRESIELVESSVEVVQDNNSCSSSPRVRAKNKISSIFGRQAMAIEEDVLIEAMEKLRFDDEMIEMAMRLSVEAGKPTVAYVRGILNNWVKDDIYTVAAYEEAQKRKGKAERSRSEVVEEDVDVGAAEKLRQLNRRGRKEENDECN